MSIVSRLFGSPIPKEVQKKLEDRQKVAGEVAFGDSIEAVYPNKDGKNQADLSSRTPFVRMWTSVKLIEPAQMANVLESITLQEYLNYINTPPSSPNPPDIVTRMDKFRTKHPKTSILPVVDDDGEVMDGKKYKFYIIKDPESSDGTEIRDQVDYTRKIYDIGNHNYQESYGEVTPGELIGADGYTETEDSKLYDVFTSELEKNPLMKPQSGITSISTETEGTLGVIKKTVVNFVVHNFYDYDRIYNKYFLRPGATIFVDFGWSSVKSLYNPENLINDKEGLEIFLYGDTSQGDSKNGEVTKNQGDLEVLQGIVTDYNAKILQNGSVECSVTLTSSNTSLLSFDTDGAVARRIKAILENGILFLGVQEIIDDSTEGNDLKQLLNTPDHNSDAVDIENYNKNLKILAARLFVSQNGMPTGNSVETGVFINNLTMEDNYISFGLFEDLIVNSQFGFGKNIEDINTGKGTQVRMNSSNSYIRWDKKYANGQKTMLSVSEDSPDFLYPDKWGKESNSYSFQKDKLPKFKDENDKMVSYQDGELSTDSDITLGRIPLRELFINVDVIINAFEQNDNVKKSLKQILKSLTEKSMNLFQLKLISGDNTDSEIKIVDENYLFTGDEKQIYDEKNFKFNVMNPNSIVKDYNLEFKLPSGNIGNMYAIQGASHGDNIFSIKEGVINSKALSKQYSDSLSIIYEPDLGSFRLNQLLDTKSESDVYNVYNQVNRLLESNIYNVSTTSTGYDLIEGVEINEMMTSDTAITGTSDKTVSKKITSADLIKRNIENQEAVGIKVVESLYDYYKQTTAVKIIKKTPRLLPYTLSLTTYGIASVNPGDTFEVDYLPKMYLKDTYLQIMKVTHNVGADGWYTTFDTQFRLKSYVASREEAPVMTTRLSPNIISKLGFGDYTFKIDNNSWTNWFDDEVTLNNMLPYFTDIDVVEKDGYDLVLNMKTTNKLSDIMQEGGGKLQHPFTSQTDFSDKKYFRMTVFQKPTETHITENFTVIKSNSYAKEIMGQDFWSVYPSDIILKPNRQYRIYIVGSRLMIWDIESMKEINKAEEFFKNADEKMSEAQRSYTSGLVRYNAEQMGDSGTQENGNFR